MMNEAALQHPAHRPHFTSELRRLLRAIASADHAALRRAADEARALEHAGTQGAPAATVTRLISALSDAVTRRAIALAGLVPGHGMPRWCWIALGSEGRQEQTFLSDQDNGLILEGDASPAEMRALLLPLARQVNDILADCRFPACPGGIMAGNPDCCLSLREWRERFACWINMGDPQALLNATIFFDLRGVEGDMALAHNLSALAARHAADNKRFLFQMAENALRRRPPLSLLLHRLLPEKTGPHAGAIDLKHNAAAIYVDAARVFGLACGAGVSNTVARLRLAARCHLIDPVEAADWERCFGFISMLRLRLQQEHYLHNEPMQNHVPLKALNAGDRRALRHALYVTRAMQQRLSQVFLAGGSGF